eukprot:5748564-Lingulodinium_polyedra.AAC.1
MVSDQQRDSECQSLKGLFVGVAVNLINHQQADLDYLALKVFSDLATLSRDYRRQKLGYRALPQRLEH